MRSNIKMLCVTNWNAVLELNTQPFFWKVEYDFAGRVIGLSDKEFNSLLNVADPCAIDAGMIISLDEIKLVARIKK